MSSDLVALVRAELTRQIHTLESDVRSLHTVTEQSGYSDGIPAYTVANLPVAGLGNGTTFVTVAFASNGRKSGEAAGLGTGQLVYFDTPSGLWLRVRDDSVITA